MYEDLDPTAHYKMKVVYGGDSPEKMIQCTANDTIEIHPYINKKVPYGPVEFDIPPEATSHGRLKLTWHRELGQGRNGRGCQVSEIWLIKK
jgi:hypothetical protein